MWPQTMTLMQEQQLSPCEIEQDKCPAYSIGEPCHLSFATTTGFIMSAVREAHCSGPNATGNDLYLHQQPNTVLMLEALPRAQGHFKRFPNSVEI